MNLRSPTSLKSLSASAALTVLLPTLGSPATRGLADEAVGGVDCYVVRTESIDRVPRPRIRTSWISKAEFVPLRVEYERFGRPSRSLPVPS